MNQWAIRHSARNAPLNDSTCASSVGLRGLEKSIRTIPDLIGHLEIQTAARCAHHAPGCLAEAVERLVALIAAPEGGKLTPVLTPRNWSPLRRLVNCFGNW
jgi:hypothetical protein